MTPLNARGGEHIGAVLASQLLVPRSWDKAGAVGQLNLAVGEETAEGRCEETCNDPLVLH